MKHADKITALKIKYKNSFAEKHATLIALSSAYQKNNTEENHHNLHAFVHNLAGSAGLYGYDNISDNARKTINALRQNLPVSVVIETINGLLECLQLEQ